jgi:pyridoxamine 5'-phosphate oxidase
MNDLIATQNPLDQFNNWYQAAQKQDLFEPTKMTLATVDEQGMPSARIVLLKKYNETGFYFYTNYESQKAKELLNNNKVALVFHWDKPFHQQIRIRGIAEKISYKDSDLYFQTRDRGSQIGAWASPQSQKIKSREELIELFKTIEEKFKNKKVPCPENWGGFCVQPLSFEFWQAQDYRLHDRVKFSRESLNSGWTVSRLAP